MIYLCNIVYGHPEDKKHSVRVAIGNGLRPDIWERFQKRFNIPVICEFYGATEAPFFSANTDNTVGAIGKFTPIWKLITGLTLIKYDYETAEPIRDAKGRCIPVSRGKVGLLLCPINDRARYDGYSGDKKLSEQKVVRNVFKEGDAYFNSGDLLMLDKNYYLHFVDRLGDTFRWKGENVATTEVSEIVTLFPDIKEANVYGVKVPGQDGRAGMAAIILEDDQVFRLKEFYDYITSSLPLYACPRFLRVMKTLETTGTYKYKKGDLVREGFDPNKVKEPMYFIDLNANTYSPLDEISFGKIVAGKSRL
ncbi:long-chain fatty acid transport protein 2-like [Saccoglossus kowalevskii]|uniref:Very long-chain acyl-CoA synthetase-like n=1 Tax=Saccoglossus kowalevskii TaxID=10224 RepID=A0ABM0GZJ3_SACKO|nr:PREDICTED: very long-chain acyl-CoA synthetase-like [Saccoglossus kowalevskii]